MYKNDRLDFLCDSGKNVDVYSNNNVNHFCSLLAEPINLQDYEIALCAIFLPKELKLASNFAYLYSDVCQASALNEKTLHLLSTVFFPHYPDTYVYRPQILLYIPCTHKKTNCFRFQLATVDGAPFIKEADSVEKHESVTVQVCMRKK